MRTPPILALVLLQLATAAALALEPPPDPAPSEAAPKAGGAPAEPPAAELLRRSYGISDAPTGPATTEPAAAPAATPEVDGAIELYHRAFVALATGRAAEAVELLRKLATDFPAHTLAGRALEVVRLLEGRATSTAPVSPAGEAALAPEGEQPTGLARAELVIFQTIHGIALGAEACMALECDDPRALVGALVLLGGAGLGGSLAATQDGIRPGQTLLLNSSTLWGFWHGLALGRIGDVDSVESMAALVMGSQLGGLAAGGLLWGQLQPTAGDVSMVNSAGIWGGALALLAHGINDFEAKERDIWLTLLLASDVAGVSAAVASRAFPMSRGRTLLIDVGGLGGMLLGMGADVLIEGENVDSTSFFALALGGTALGLAAGTYLSRDWDVPEVPARLTLLPARGGAMLAVAYDF